MTAIHDEPVLVTGGASGIGQLTDFFGLNNAMDAFRGRAPADDA